jgi:O-acetyl-ADP-ribose deacetylase (regulator of RNase III)
MNSRTYEVGRSTITLLFGDITASKAEALVSSDDYLLSMGGGVSGALRRAGGSQIAADASKMVPAKVGDVVISSAGGLSAKYILHAVTIGPGQAGMEPGVIVRQTSRRAMELLPFLGCTSIAFPAIGAGLAGIPYETVAGEMAAVLVRSVINSAASNRIELYLKDRFERMSEDDFFVFFEQFAARKLGLATSATTSIHLVTEPASASPEMNAEETSQVQRRHQIYTMLRHLDARRSKLEADLISALTRSEPPEEASLASLKTQLSEIQALRLSYEAELSPFEQARPATHDSVFVSSTTTDLKLHRKAVRETIESLRLNFVGMEDFTPTELAPASLIRQKVIESELYLGILGMRYGYVDPGTGLSMTELEYNQARASGKPIHMFLMDDGAAITAGMVETDSVRFARLVEFKTRVMKDHTCALFVGPDDLASKARSTLERPPS